MTSKELVNQYKAEKGIHLNAYDTESLVLFTDWLLKDRATKKELAVTEADTLQSKWLALSEDEKSILGRPNFACGRIADRMRQMGFACDNKAEMEQALVIFTMLQFYNEHGENWAEKMNEFLKPNNQNPTK